MGNATWWEREGGASEEGVPWLLVSTVVMGTLLCLMLLTMGVLYHRYSAHLRHYFLIRRVDRLSFS